MKNQNQFPDWGDLDDGKESVWACEWFIDDNQESSEIFLSVSYKFKDEFVLSYLEVDSACKHDSVKELLAEYIKDEIQDEDLVEIKDFFNRWLDLVDSNGNLNFDYGDDEVSERDDEFHEVTNRTLH